MSSNFLTDLPNEIGNLSELVQLRLGINQLSSVSPALKNLQRLEVLKFMPRVSVKMHVTMSNLQELLLNNSKLCPTVCRFGNGSFLGLAKLAYLDLPFNQIEQLPDHLDCLTSLNVFLLSNNLLRTLPQSVALLSSLTLLKLSNNQLSFLPQHFGSNLPSLTELALDSNKLTSLPESLAGVETLEYLDLHSNTISELPAELGRLSKLAILNLRNNLLVSLPPELGQVSLRLLDLSDNQRE